MYEIRYHFKQLGYTINAQCHFKRLAYMLHTCYSKSLNECFIKALTIICLRKRHLGPFQPLTEWPETLRLIARLKFFGLLARRESSFQTMNILLTGEKVNNYVKKLSLFHKMKRMKNLF